MTGSFEAEPQDVRVTVDVSGLPAVMALARAARDVVDHAEHVAATGEIVIAAADLRALEDAVQPIYPGSAT